MSRQYVIRRVLIAIPSIFGISIVLFTVLALAPGDPFGELAANPAIPPEVAAALRAKFGLDDPVWTRYWHWLLAMLQGDWGFSFASRINVDTLILQRLPTTLIVIGAAQLLAILVALPVGVLAGTRPYSIFDQIANTFAFIGFSLPTFFTGLLLILVFKGASLVRYVRSAVLDVVRLDYVTTARSKGIGERAVVLRHVVRTALIPVVTLIALQLPVIFGGAIVTEQIFRVPGIGSLLISAMLANDTPVVMAVTFVLSCLVVIFNLIADIIYGWLDPRISYR